MPMQYFVYEYEYLIATIEVFSKPEGTLWWINPLFGFTWSLLEQVFNIGCTDPIGDELFKKWKKKGAVV